MPLPRPETTPPVTKTIFGRHTHILHIHINYTNLSLYTRCPSKIKNSGRCTCKFPTPVPRTGRKAGPCRHKQSKTGLHKSVHCFLCRPAKRLHHAASKPDAAGKITARRPPRPAGAEATSPRLVRVSMARFSIRRCASASVMPRFSISMHLARSTRRSWAILSVRRAFSSSRGAQIRRQQLEAHLHRLPELGGRKTALPAPARRSAAVLARNLIGSAGLGQQQHPGVGAFHGIGPQLVAELIGQRGVDDHDLKIFFGQTPAGLAAAGHNDRARVPQIGDVPRQIFVWR